MIDRMVRCSAAGSLLFAASLAVALYVLTFPLQDYDTFWHMAYGRAMVESGSFINHEIFSYTASGKYLGSHSQLAQVILYGLWAAGGATALLVFKLLVAAIVFLLIATTARLFGAGTISGAALGVAALTAGMTRLVERPELFSVLFQALLLWLVFRARRSGYSGRELWLLPPLMVLWDYLHGSVYGLVVLGTFVGAEFFRVRFLPKIRHRVPVAEGPPVQLHKLLLPMGVTFGCMLAHPNGLLNYTHFWRVGSSAEYRMYGEFMSPTTLQYVPFWLFLGATLLVVIWRWRRCDLTTLALLIPFLVLSLMYSRAVLAFCLAAIPAVSQALALPPGGEGASPRKKWFAVIGLVLLLGSALLYKQQFVIELFRFGTGVNEKVFPVGSARFVEGEAQGGNMYNNNAFGGYLAFTLAPERKIFHYNQPGVFTALFDYLHKPVNRREWQIDYAIVRDSLEYNMFDREGYVTVYMEPMAAVMVRNDERNAALIERHQVQYFSPLLSEAELLKLGGSPFTGERLLREMATYLRYREDVRIARLFARLLRESPVSQSDVSRVQLLEPVLTYNANAAPLLLLYGEILYRQKNFIRAEELLLQARNLVPEDLNVNLLLGNLNYEQARYPEAFEHFARVVKVNPRIADGQYALGLAALKLCRKDEAQRGFEQFLTLAPQSPYASKARAYLQNLDQACR